MEGVPGLEWLLRPGNVEYLALAGLNSMSQVRSHSCKVPRSVWRVFASSSEVTVK